MKKINILDFLPRGIENAISMAELAARANCDPRTARQLVYNARLGGEIICSSCDDENGGYFIPIVDYEVERYVKMQKSRIKSAQAAVKSAEDYIAGIGG